MVFVWRKLIALFLWAGNVYDDLTTAEVATIESGDRFCGIRFVCEFDKSESAGTTGKLVGHDTSGNHFPKLGKHLVELGVIGRPWQTAHE